MLRAEGLETQRVLLRKAGNSRKSIGEQLGFFYVKLKPQM
jgi:hypothetical protein